MSCCDLSSKKGVYGLIVRISFGLSLFFHGIKLYMMFPEFQGMTKDGLGVLEPLGMVWAYLLPGLMILGGALLVVNMYPIYAVWASGLALGSIPAGMLLKPLLSDAASPEMMSAVNGAFIWLLMLFVVIKTMCCCCSGGSCDTKK